MTYDDPEFDGLVDEAHAAIRAGRLDASMSADVANVLANEQALQKSRQADMRLLNDLSVKTAEARLPKGSKRASPGGMDPARFNRLVAKQQGQELAMEAGVSRMMESLQSVAGNHASIFTRISAMLDAHDRLLRDILQSLERSRD
jgi:hypothetical protein